MSEEPQVLQELRGLVHRKNRFTLEAYLFLYQALDCAQRLVGEKRHVSGRELLQGYRALAAEMFGPLALMVFDVWGVSTTEHVGEMVFDLVECGLMGKTDDDSQDDFEGVYDFQEAFDPDTLLAEIDPQLLPAYRPVRRDLPQATRVGVSQG